MANESRFFTVKFVKTAPNQEGSSDTDIEVYNYQASEWNAACLKFNELSTYARSLAGCSYFRVSILNEWDGVEKVDTESEVLVPVTPVEGE